MRFFFFFLFAFLSPVIAFSEQKEKVKTTFTTSDIFQSAVFHDNNGLIPDLNGQKILYYVDHADIRAYFTEKGVIYQLTKDVTGKDKDKHGRPNKEDDEDAGQAALSISLAFMNWEGANPHPQVIAGNARQGYYTYINKEGNTYKTLTSHGYGSIRYKDLYPGIDVEYIFPAGKKGIEYNLIVQPGADPTIINMVYSGNVKHLTKAAGGNLVIHTPNGDIVEHAPKTYYNNGQAVASAFVLKGKRFQFSFPEGYDHSQALVIDPWVTTLTSLPATNMGFKVDYDFAGNLFAYGAGPSSSSDFSEFFEVSKYDVNGNLLWTFNGNLPSVPWTTAYLYYDFTNQIDYFSSFNEPGGFIVDKVTGKSYLGQGINDYGTQTIRLDQNGNYDNFISTASNSFYETWGYAYNCANSSILAMGGGSNSDLNMGVINTSSGAVATSNVTGLSGTHQDIICGTYDSTGNLYIILNSNANSLPYLNTIYRVNTSINGSVWNANSGYSSFSEHQNTPFWSNDVPAGNWFNALAANGSYLYYYDGYILQAFNLASGVQVGNPYYISGYNTLYQGGIAVDNCNNVYIGGQGAINTFSFDGTNFNPQADISLGNAFQNSAVLDIRYNQNSNLLYVTGNGVAGTYNATLSSTCNPPSSYLVATARTCTTATVRVSPSAALTPKVFSYIWSDASNNVLSQLNNTTDTVNTITGLANGTYHIQVEWNSNCGGSSISDSLVIQCNKATASANDTTICQGQQVKLTGPSPGSGGTYSWAPGGANTSSITVSPNDTTIYTVTFTPVSGPSVKDTFVVNVNPTPVVTVPVTLACQGDSTSITANISPATLPNVTFLWSPGGETTQTIRIAPTSSATYSVTATFLGCSGYGSIALTIDTSPSIIAKVDTNPCAAFLIATGSGGLGPYQYSVNNGAYQSSDTFSALAPATYTVQVKDLHGCTASTSATVPQTSGHLNLILDTTGVVCHGDSTGTITASASNGTLPYQYSLNSGAFQQSGTFNNLPAGNYIVTTKDAAGCSSSSATTIHQPVALVLSLDSVNVTCSGASTGAITANVANGASPYQYALNNGSYQASNTFSNLAQGGYNVTTKDANGCSVSDSVHILQTFVLTYTIDTFNTACTGSTTGSIVVNVSAGTPPFQYSLDSGSFQAPDSFTNLAVGTYSIQIKDGNGCTVLNTGIGIHQSTQVSLTASADSVRCFGNKSATIISAASGGTLPYQFSISNGTWQSSSTFADLAAGAYTVTVQDMNSCTASSSVQIYQPSAPLIFLPEQITGVRCPGEKNGALIDSASGGTPPYNYSATNDGAIFHFSSGGIIPGLDTGVYTVYVNDNNGCIDSSSVYIPNALIDSFRVSTDSTSCFGPQYTDGAIHIIALSNTNVPYQYSLNNGQQQFSSDFLHLAKGVYNITVQNALGCIDSIPSVTVYEATEGIAAIYPSDTILSLGQSVQLTSTFGPFPQDSVVSYYWNPSPGISCIYCPNPVATPYNEQNNYTLTVTYNSHCSVTASVTILVQNTQQVFIPNSFTPNNDGINDVFYIYGSSIKTADLKIFNRWGELVFESTDQLLGWDGTYKGVPQQTGVYTYTVDITLLDDTQLNKVGSITLLK